jgi:hypothetical protein
MRYLGDMIRLRVAELLRVRGWTAYRLAREAHLPLATAYRLADPAYVPERLEVATLERLANIFKIGPGELLDRVPAKAATGTRRRLPAR